MSVKYNPRLTAPETDNKNYITLKYGGYNYCINISNGSVLPNCVGYMWGRWREILGKYHQLGRGNAENVYIGLDGYERGTTPKLYAVACWKQGKTQNTKDGYGHVAIVEKINEDGTVLVSDSAYGGARFRTVTYPKTMKKNGFTFQGFIYLPEEVIVEEQNELDQYSDEELAKMVWQGKFGNGSARVKALGSRYNSVMALVNKGVGKTSEQEKVYYTVVKGDNLTRIAKKYNTTVANLVSMNNIKNANLIYIGQIIRVK